jgi:hypothetical protein
MKAAPRARITSGPIGLMAVGGSRHARCGESDDVGRSELIDAAIDGELRALIGAVAPLYPTINAYLDETGDAEYSVPYGDLAQAAMETQFELDRRTRGKAQSP